MDSKVTLQNMEINRIFKRLNEQYHDYAAFCGLSEPAVWTLYTLFEDDKAVTQYELAAMWFYPKQTINFTVNSLVKKGYVRLEQLASAGNSKAIRLTDEGHKFCERVIAPLMKAEEYSLMRLTKQERELLVSLNEKQCVYFEEEIQNLIKENPLK